MANYYTLVMADEGLPCTEADAEAIEAAIEAGDEASDSGSGFHFSFETGMGYLMAEENGVIEEVPDTALELIGLLIDRAGKPYLECGVSFTASRLLAGSCGGTAFRIMPDGSVVSRLDRWPDGDPLAALRLIDAAYRLAERSTPANLRRAILDARPLLGGAQ
jgi:hypothetical protein